MPESVTIRPARQRDIRSIVALWNALQSANAALEDRLSVGPEAEFWFTEYVHDALDDSQTAFLVAEIGGEIVGFISGQIIRRPTLALSSCGYIADLAVAERWRWQGIGTGLYQKLRAWFAAHDVTSLEVQAVSANPNAQAFWRHQGFGEFLITYRIDP